MLLSLLKLCEVVFMQYVFEKREPLLTAVTAKNPSGSWLDQVFANDGSSDRRCESGYLLISLYGSGILNRWCTRSTKCNEFKKCLTYHRLQPSPRHILNPLIQKS